MSALKTKPLRHNFTRPPLLARQLWLLAAFAGVFATRHFWPASLGLLLIIIHQHRRIFIGRRFASVFLSGLALFFGLGAGYALWRHEEPPELPRWAMEASSQTSQHLLLEDNLARLKFPPDYVWQVADNRLVDASGGPDKKSAYRLGLRLRGRVAEVEGRADRELRLLIEDLRPLDFAAPAWPGRLAFTWRNASSPEGGRPPPAGAPSYLSRRAGGELLPARPLPGQEVEVKLRLRRVRSLMNPGLWESESYWRDRGAGLRAWEQGDDAALALGGGSGLAFKAAMLRENLRQRVLGALPADADGYLRSGAEFVPALLFGDKYLLDSRDADLFARSTLAHSLALSGLHLGYAAALGACAVFWLYRMCPPLGLRLPRRKAAVLGGAVPALLYLWLGGAPPSLLRAALMLAFVGVALFRSRPPALADALIWAVGAILLWNPAAAFDLRLQLSALCIAALAWSQPVFFMLQAGLAPAGRGPARMSLARRLARGVALILLSSFVIQLALAPLLVKTFGLYGLAMPLNVLWLPVLGFAVMPCAFLGLLASALQLPGLAGPLFQAATLPCGALLELLRGLDAAGALPEILFPRPHWAGMLGFWFLLLLAGRNVSRPKLVLGAVLTIAPFLLSSFPPLSSGPRLHLLDVGQGQSVLVEWGGRSLLLDGGGSENRRFDVGREVVAPSLSQIRLRKLDYMLASHLDADHAGGLVFPLERLRVERYADNGGAAENFAAGGIMRLLAAKNIERRVLRAGDFIDLGDGLGLEILHPALPRAAAPSDQNRDSLVLRLLWQGRGLALVCGDVDKTAQRAILRRFTPKRLSAEVLVLPHHGAASAFLPEFHRAVSPRLALASSAYGNFWNFPSPVVKNALLEAKIPLLGTASQGRISLVWKNPGAEVIISTARSGRLRLRP